MISRSQISVTWTGQQLSSGLDGRVAGHFIEVHYKTSTSLGWIWVPARKPLVCFNKVYSGVEKLVFRQSHKLKVVGSSPAPATNLLIVIKDPINDRKAMLCGWNCKAGTS